MATPVYTPLNPYAPNEIGVNGGLYVCEQTAARAPRGAAATSTLSNLPDFGETDSPWQNLANVTDFKIAPEIENDETDFWDEVVKVRVKKQNPTIIRRALSFTFTNYTPIFDAILKGVKNPTAGGYGAGQKVKCFANNNPEIPLCFMLKQYDKGGKPLQTLWFYGKILVTETVEYNNKIIKQPITIEVETSEYNELENTENFTGQTETEPNETP